MKLSNSIKEVIVKEINRGQYMDITVEDVSHSMFLAVAKAYLADKGQDAFPKEWSAHLTKVLAFNRYKKELSAHGYDDLDDLSLIELRDMVSELEYVEVRTSTATKGVCVKQIKLAA